MLFPTLPVVEQAYLDWAAANPLPMPQPTDEGADAAEQDEPQPVDDRAPVVSAPLPHDRHDQGNPRGARR